LIQAGESAGKQLPFGNKSITVAELTEASFDGVHLALFSAGGSISREYAPLAVARELMNANTQSHEACAKDGADFTWCSACP